MLVFPNPNSGRFQLVFKQSFDREVTIRLFDLSGQVVLARQLSSAPRNSEIELVVNVSSGVYFLEVGSEERVFTQRLVIQ